MNEKGRYSAGIYTGRFNSWIDALIEADIDKDRIHAHPSLLFDDFTEEVRREFDQFPEYKLFKKNECSIDNDKIHRFIDSWKQFMEENIINTSWKEYHRNVFLEDVNRVREELGQESLSLGDYKRSEAASYSYQKAYRLFGSCEVVLEELGLEKKPHPAHISGEEHPAYVHGESDSIEYGDSWTEELKKNIRERDGWRCRVCGKRNRENIGQFGCQLNVHHIKPHWTWNIPEEHEEMNSENNLISLCNSCHSSLERKWQDASPEEFAEKGKEYLGIEEQTNGEMGEGKGQSVFAY